MPLRFGAQMLPLAQHIPGVSAATARAQSIEIPAALSGTAFFSISLATNFCMYSGERRSGATVIAPTSFSRSCTEGVSIAATVADRFYVVEHGNVVDMIPREKLEALEARVEELELKIQDLEFDPLFRFEVIPRRIRQVKIRNVVRIKRCIRKPAAIVF